MVWLLLGSGFSFGSGLEYQAQLQLHGRHTVSLRHSSSTDSRALGSGKMQNLFRAKDLQKLSLTSVNLLVKRPPQ